MVYYLLEILGEKNVRGHLCLSQFQALSADYLQMCRESMQSATNIYQMNEINVEVVHYCF